MATATEACFKVCMIVVQLLSRPAGLWSVGVMNTITDCDSGRRFLTFSV